MKADEVKKEGGVMGVPKDTEKKCWLMNTNKGIS